MTRHVAYLANEVPWPVVNGGRERMAVTVEGLVACGVRVTVLASTVARVGEPPAEPVASGAVAVRRLPPVKSTAAGFLRGRPLLTASLLDAGVRTALERELERLRPDCLVVSHSYLASCPLPRSLPLAVDFPNLERERQRALAADAAPARSVLHRWEARKAQRWEPRVARDAQLCVAVTDADAEDLRALGAARVVTVPNLPEGHLVGASPQDGYALLVGNFAYPPNAEALRRVLERVWPAVRRERPAARLVVAGQGSVELCGQGHSDGVDARGFVTDLRPLYEGAALVLGPVSRGAGTQLKVLAALRHGRPMVVTGYSARSVPQDLRRAVRVADGHDDFALEVVRGLDDHAWRRHAEDLLRSASWPTAAEAVAPLCDWIETC